MSEIRKAKMGMFSRIVGCGCSKGKVMQLHGSSRCQCCKGPLMAPILDDSSRLLPPLRFPYSFLYFSSQAFLNCLYEIHTLCI